MALVGELIVEVVEGTDLPAMDIGGTSDPYIILHFEDQYCKTRTIEKSLNPKWNETFKFKVHNPTALLKVTVYDQDLITDDWIGQFSYKIAELTQTDNPPSEENGKLVQRCDKWFQLLSRDNETVADGKIHLRIRYVFTQIRDFLSTFALAQSIEIENVDKKRSLWEREDFLQIKGDLIRLTYRLLPLIRGVGTLTRWHSIPNAVIQTLLFSYIVYNHYLLPSLIAIFIIYMIRNYMLFLSMKGEEVVPSEDDMLVEILQEIEELRDRKLKLAKILGKLSMLTSSLANKMEMLHKAITWRDFELGKMILFISCILFVFLLFVPAISVTFVVLHWSFFLLGIYHLTLGALYRKYPKFAKKYHTTALISFGVQFIKMGVRKMVEKPRASPKQLPLALSNDRTSSASKSLEVEEISLEPPRSEPKKELKGYLEKQGDKLRKWKLQYFVLRGKLLYRFKNEKSQEPRSIIDISEYSGIEIKLKQRAHSYDLHNSKSGRHLVIAFPSESERILWVNAFSSFVQKKEQFEAEVESDSEPKMVVWSVHEFSVKANSQRKFEVSLKEPGHYILEVEKSDRIPGRKISCTITMRDKNQDAIIKVETGLIGLVDKTVKTREFYAEETGYSLDISVSTNVILGSVKFNIRVVKVHGLEGDSEEDTTTSTSYTRDRASSRDTIELTEDFEESLAAKPEGHSNHIKQRLVRKDGSWNLNETEADSLRLSMRDVTNNEYPKL